MPDREKVIKGIAICLSRFHCGEDCPYYTGKTGCMESLQKDTLALLKEQEPRVLTWEEAEKAEVCWLEQRGYEPYVTDDADTWNPEIYGEEYRCWSAMPTNEQRKAAKWG